MRQFISPPAVTVAADTNLTDLLLTNVAEAPTMTAFRRQRSDGSWQDVSWREFHQEVVALAKGLICAGVAPGDRLGIMSRTRYEWTLCDVAIWFAGAVTVPVYETSSPHQVDWISKDSELSALFVENTELIERIGQTEHAKTVKRWSLTNGDLDELRAQGSAVDDDEVEERRSKAGLSDLATIIYTSGTTGRPKGACLTHGNFFELATNTTSSLAEILTGHETDDDGLHPSTLLFIPLAHVFARFIQVLCLASRATVGHTSDVKNVLNDLESFQPTFVLAVPRVFEKIYNSAEGKAILAKKGQVFSKAADTAIAYSEALDKGRPPLGLTARHKLFDALVYRKLRKALGGRVRYAVSGGAPLGARLGHFFRGAGVSILEGYGLTETTAPTSVNTPSATEIGSVGRPLPGCGIAIAEDGEVLLQGVHIFDGYWKNEEATKEAFVDGWFRTGDLGRLSEGNFLHITGRKKDILVTAGGKNVAPAQLEDQIRSHALVSQALVVGDKRKFIACLVTLDEELLALWCNAEGLEPMTVKEAVAHPKVREAVQQAIDEANHTVSRAEAIKTFAILDTDFTVESGHLTPSMKVKRNVITQDFAKAIDKLYAD